MNRCSFYIDKKPPIINELEIEIRGRIENFLPGHKSKKIKKLKNKKSIKLLRCVF
jgi:hypothetical protein